MARVETKMATHVKFDVVEENINIMILLKQVLG